MVQTGNQIEGLNGYSTESCDELGYGLTNKCDHVQKSCDAPKVRKALKANGILRECPLCTTEPAAAAGEESVATSDELAYEFDETLWFCLQCGAQLCGRAKNQHALAHNTKAHSDEHNLTINTTNFIVWCYKCDEAVLPTMTKKLQSCVDLVRKECAKSVSSLAPPAPASVPAEKESAPAVIEEVQSGLAPVTSAKYFDIETLPRVRGLSNLGNTCFFNAVLQCLSQTPFLLEVLQESRDPGEKFQLPGGILKLDTNEEVLLKQISGELNSFGTLTSVLVDTLEALQSGSGGVHSPSALLKQLSQKWPQFGNGDQQDSHELLRHLLESVRCEDLRRYQSVILKLLGYSSKVDPNQVDGVVKQKIKYYGNQVQDRILRPEPVFRGFLVSTLQCQDCYNTSSRHESFLDISLPISMDKPHPPMRRKSTSPEPMEGGTSRSQSKKLARRERRAKRASKKANKGLSLDTAATTANSGTAAGASSGGEQTDGDVEDNDDDTTPAEAAAAAAAAEAKKKAASVVDDNGNAEKEVRNEMVELGISQPPAKLLTMLTNSAVEQMDGMSLEDVGRRQQRRQRTYSTANWCTTLAPKYQCEDGECSVQSCLNNFTLMELMTGNNKVTCDACTERINGKGGKSVYTTATKQFLISSPPAVLILHLKRFQCGPRSMFRKMTKHVTFPLVLDIAPFCASKVKKLENVRPHQKQLPYSLYGIVEHSGTMGGGHYVAYVKVRQKLHADDPRWAFLPKGSRAELDQIDEQIAAHDVPDSDESSEMSSLTSSASSASDTSSGASSDVEGAVGGRAPEPKLPAPLPGKWYYVSDSRVQAVKESEVLNTQAYLLFYERIETTEKE